MTVTEFLNARLDEDEAAGKACGDCDGYLTWFDSRVLASGDHTIRTQPGNRTVARIRRDDVEGDFGHLLNPDAVAVHIARHDPARTLREVAAKRAIITRYAAVLQSFNDRGNGLWPDVSRREKSHAYATLCDLAAIWSDHPDYRDGWAS